jgi:hypothetical protein
MLDRTSSHRIPVRAMTALAAGLFVGMIAPLTGGPIKPYELREFRAAVTALANGETSTPSLEPAYYPHSGQRMPDVTGANGNYYYLAEPPAAAGEAETPAQPALQTETLERLPPIDAAAPEGVVAAAMQVLDEPLDACLDCEIEPESTGAEAWAPLESEEAMLPPELDAVKSDDAL